MNGIIESRILFVENDGASVCFSWDYVNKQRIDILKVCIRRVKEASGLDKLKFFDVFGTIKNEPEKSSFIEDVRKELSLKQVLKLFNIDELPA